MVIGVVKSMRRSFCFSRISSLLAVGIGLGAFGLGCANPSPVRAAGARLCSGAPHYPKLGSPVNGHLSHADMFKMSDYDDLVGRELLACHGPGSTAAQRRLDQADGYQYLVMSGALLHDAGQEKLGDAKMRSAIAALKALINRAEPLERAHLISYLLQTQELYRNPEAQSLADQP